MTRKRPAKLFSRGGGTGKAVLMAQADGYVMARRPGCIPFVIPQKEWDAMPDYWQWLLENAKQKGTPP